VIIAFIGAVVAAFQHHRNKTRNIAEKNDGPEETAHDETKENGTLGSPPVSEMPSDSSNTQSCYPNSAMFSTSTDPDEVHMPIADMPSYQDQCHTMLHPRGDEAMVV
jgi:hypothetical protein